MLINDYLDTTVRTTAQLWSWKTRKGHGKGHGKSWNFESLKEYKP